MYNNEHYPDPTAEKALDNIDKEKLNNTIKYIKKYIDSNGYELMNRIVLKDKYTGKIYK